MATFKCQVVGANKSLYTGDVSMLIVRAKEGDIGILAGHTPLIALLRPGVLRIQKPDGSWESIYVGDGIVEVQPHIVTVLAKSIEAPANLSEEESRERQRASRQILLEFPHDRMKVENALTALEESSAQLRAIELRNNGM